MLENSVVICISMEISMTTKSFVSRLPCLLEYNRTHNINERNRDLLSFWILRCIRVMLQATEQITRQCENGREIFKLNARPRKGMSNKNVYHHRRPFHQLFTILCINYPGADTIYIHTLLLIYIKICMYV